MSLLDKSKVNVIFREPNNLIFESKKYMNQTNCAIISYNVIQYVLLLFSHFMTIRFLSFLKIYSMIISVVNYKFFETIFASYKW